MVSREQISKTINYIISKSHVIRVGTFSLNNNIKDKLNEFRGKTSDLEHETVEFINSKGEVVFSKDSNPRDDYKIEFTDEEINKLGNQGEYDLIIEHNHPGAYGTTLTMGGSSVTVSVNDTIPTILSKGDVMNLWHKGTSYIEETNDVLNVARFRGVVAECPNGSRMSLIRKEETTENGNVVVNDTHRETEIEFEKTYEILHNKWNHFREDYEMQCKIHMKKWCEEQESKGYEWDTSKYLREKSKFGFKYSKEYFDEKYLNDVIQDFDRLGFELSVEWRNKYYDK